MFAISSETVRCTVWWQNFASRPLLCMCNIGAGSDVNRSHYCEVNTFLKRVLGDKAYCCKLRRQTVKLHHELSHGWPSCGLRAI